jgi:hypothetical protein
MTAQSAVPLSHRFGVQCVLQHSAAVAVAVAVVYYGVVCSVSLQSSVPAEDHYGVGCSVYHSAV